MLARLVAWLRSFWRPTADELAAEEESKRVLDDQLTARTRAFKR